jgi:tetratricopeptide (TPR) repeat protein
LKPRKRDDRHAKAEIRQNTSQETSWDMTVRGPFYLSFLLVAYPITMPVAPTITHQPAQSCSNPAKQNELGTVDFPTSTRSREAQAHFLRGVAALHSFWYPVALEEFRAATKIDPDFAMGYWGEAMVHNHPLWDDPQETDAARRALARITMAPELTARERAYIEAVTVLYGEGSKSSRDRAYARVMQKVYRDYPDDIEAALFYALALLGNAGDGLQGSQKRLLAGMIASTVFEQKPHHPGAAHYVIHAYDNPKDAHRALDAALLYADIAPAAPHALHMPAHIFVQLGMWPEAAASNAAAWEASDAWVTQNGHSPNKRDYHSLQWMQYAYLQLGRYEKAASLLDTMKKSWAEFPKDQPRSLSDGGYILARMAASYLVETQQWDKAETILGPALPQSTGESPEADKSSRVLATLAETPIIFSRGLAAAMDKSALQAQESITALRKISREPNPDSMPFVNELRHSAELQAMNISATLDIAQGKHNAAIRKMEQATALIDAAPPPSGPPLSIKPVHELFGEILLRAGRPDAAAKHFDKALGRYPDRARSLLGAAAAATQNGDSRQALTLYSKFIDQWQHADPQLAEIQAAQMYFQQSRAEGKH